MDTPDFPERFTEIPDGLNGLHAIFTQDGVELLRTNLLLAGSALKYEGLHFLKQNGKALNSVVKLASPFFNDRTEETADPYRRQQRAFEQGGLFALTILEFVTDEEQIYFAQKDGLDCYHYLRTTPQCLWGTYTKKML